MTSEHVTLLDALRAVPGVASADIEPDERPEGAGTLRLQLAPGADEVQVATSVNRVLREQFGLAVDANRVQVVEESVPVRPSVAAPAAAPAPDADGYDDHPAAGEGVPPAAVSETPRPSLTAVPTYREPAPQPVPEPEPAPEPEAESSGPQSLSGPVMETIVGDQIEADPLDLAGEPLPVRPQRILIQRMQLVSAGLGVTTEVTLSWGGDAFAGGAAAAATPSSVHRSVAQATLRAVEAVVGGRARFELEQLELNQLGPDRAVVVVVSMLTKVGSERLTGVSVIREDVRQAVIRATLDALNRRIEALLSSA